MRGSPVGGAPASSSSVTPCARASGSSSSRVGRRSPDSSRDRVLTEMPVVPDRSARVVSRCWRSARSRGPTAASAWSRSPSMPTVCQNSKAICHLARPPGMLIVEVVMGADQLGDSYDVVVAGGGAAGLSGALMLARSRRPVVVIDAGAPRNGPASGVHGFLSQDGIRPGELLERGRDEVRRYGGQVVPGEVSMVTREEGGFAVTLATGRAVRARRLLVATGLADELPDIPGLRARWGREVVHCPYCHGWEVRDRLIGVLATGPMSVHQALLFRQWTGDLRYFPNGLEPNAEEKAKLAAVGVPVVAGR